MNLPQRDAITIMHKSDSISLSGESILDSVVALANTDGGCIYLVVEDDGTHTGMQGLSHDVARLASYVATNTVPPIATRTNVRIDENKKLKVIEVEVPRSTMVVSTVQGKMLRRRRRADGILETVPMYPYEIPVRLSNLDRLDYSALPVLGARMEDLDPTEIARLREIVDNETNADKSLLKHDDEQLLDVLRLVSDEGGERIPNVAGLLLLGKASVLESVLPEYGAVFRVLTGTTVCVKRDFVYPILHAVQEMESLLEAWNPEREYFRGLLRYSVSEFDHRAFREAVVNAFAHRDYTRFGRVLVEVNDEGLIVSNPGGFIEGICTDNLLEVEPRGRNPRLMTALKRIGLADSACRGVDRILEGSLVSGRPLPEWSESSDASVRLFIPRGVSDEAFMDLLHGERKRTGTFPSLRQMLVLDALKRLGRCSTEGLSDHLPMSQAMVESAVEQLVESRIVGVHGEGRSRTYALNSCVYAPKDGVGAHVGRSDVDVTRQKDLIMDLVERQGYVANRDVVDMLHIGNKQAYKLLKRLVDDKRLTLHGKGAGAKYRLPALKE